MKQLIILTCLLLLPGCSKTMVSYNGCSTYWDESSFPIVISPDDSYTGEDIAWVEQAAQMWNIAVEAQVFVVMPGVLQQYDYLGHDAPEGIVMMHRDLADPLLGWCPVLPHFNRDGRRGRTWRGVCTIDNVSIKYRQTYLNVVVHELGHGLGFPHDADTESIMYPLVSSLDNGFAAKHLDTVRQMMEGTYKGKSLSGLSSCL